MRPYRALVLAPIIAGAVSTAGLSAMASPPQAAEPSSMWVWSQVRPTQLVAVASANGIDQLYVFVTNSPDAAEKQRLRRLGQQASAAGITLWALSGEPRWALRPADALAWQEKALRIGVFAGTHLDVEPYALPGWEDDQARVVQRYLSMLEKMQAASDLPLHADVPFWYGTIPSGDETLADAVLDRVDGVTVMSYRDTATGNNSLWDVASDMVGRGDEAGVPVELAVETNPLADCPHCTFAEEGGAAMHDVVDAVDGIASPHPSYNGFAVHDYDGFVALRP